MSMIDRSLDGMASLSGHLGALLKRRLREVGGIALLSLAMMAALALATWSVQDPSLSHATDAPVRNLLGMPGAIAADLMMQLLGLGSLALLLPIAVWGYRLLGHRPLNHERLRVLLWLAGAVLTAAFASCLPK
ncbi:MAG: DNA translocase FtsK 4TM domain-containing protein, partial [Xanthobacteraceae bacterium]